jgi:hypothetical protein
MPTFCEIKGSDFAFGGRAIKKTIDIRPERRFRSA